VAYSLWEKDPEKYKEYSDLVHVLWPPDSKNFSKRYSTVDVKTDSLGVMERVGLFVPAELAHADMIVRARHILNRLGVEPELVVAPMVKSFDPMSIQPQIRGGVNWTIREALTRVEHLVFGRVKF
jgi:hypothetical protein